ncbi:MAG: glycoside hydrolase family 16 protein [Gammaproteobacteria bacterium]|nr:glycoside hydrolase family 16 protein [Gammaproteobacteria bacterium]
MHLMSRALLRLLTIIIPVIVLTGCFGEGDGQERILGTLPETDDDPGDFVLVFADEFEGTALSSANWNIETGYGPNNDGNGNNEWQLYTDSPDNVRVEDGNLVLSALCPTPPCGVRDDTITSGKINSLGKFNFKFGRVEARIKVPVGAGAWPAFWALGANHPDVGWPRSGEIDFMEVFNTDSNPMTTHFALHWCDENQQDPDSPVPCFPAGQLSTSQQLALAESLGDDFHVYEAEWDANRIVGKIDGTTYFTRSINPATMEEFLREFFLIFNVAMGGTLGSDDQPPDGSEIFPQTMLVDYVRVYQRADDAGLLFDFEDDGGPYTFSDFEGGAGSVVDNPDMSGINPSARVGQMQKFAGAEFAGSTLETSLDVSAGSAFTMKVWSQREVPVLFKLEGDSPVEVSVTHGGTGWEELIFNLPDADGSYTGITFIFDNGTEGDAGGDPDNWTFYFDDIRLISGDDSSGGTVVDFEDDGAPYVFTDFEGGVGFVTDNPHMTGINTSAKVAQMWKFAGGALFAGTTLQTPVDVIAGSTITMKVWSPREVEVLFKLEGDPDLEDEVTHGGTGWEVLTFDLPGASGSYTGITFIFDNGIEGDSKGDPDNWTFYIDDITVTPGDGVPLDPVAIPVAFEDNAGPYLFNNFEGGVAEVVDNPDQAGINTSARVGRMQKFFGAVFAGSTLKFALDVPDDSALAMKVWSQREVPVLFKLEGDPDTEVEVDHGGTGWEELTFNFPGTNGSYTGITLIFDEGTAGDAANDPDGWTFYFDDIDFTEPDVGGGEDPPPTDFEDAGGPYMFTDFGGAVTAVVDNPDATGINTSTKVGQMQKFATGGQVFAGSTLDLGGAVDFSRGEVYTMKVRAQRKVPVRFKLEGVGQERDATHSGSGTWEELCFDFTGSTSGADVMAISLFFDFGVVGAAETDPDNWTFEFDDIQQTTSCGGRAVNLADFEASAGLYDFGVAAGFAGGAASVVANPYIAESNSSAQVGRMLKYDVSPSGGATLALKNPVEFPGGSMLTMKVWSPRGVDVLLRLGGGPVAEATATHDGAGWEVLSFDFSGVSGNGTDAITLIFDKGTNGRAASDPGNWTFYFDDITLGGGIPVSFD